MSETIENEEIKNLKREVAKLRLEGNLRKSLSNQLTIQKKIADDAKAEALAKSEEVEKISKQLAKYLSPQIHEQIFSGKQSAEVKSNRKKLTVFFSDIVGFTDISDELESEEMTNLLNFYLNEMSQIALRFGGTIDKFIGDALMIFFGDPDTNGPQEDARKCIQMALEMQKLMNQLSGYWSKNYSLKQDLKIRIGINTGFCTVGNFGSLDRLDYTAIGSTVNLASRLESIAEAGSIIISEDTFALVNNFFTFKKPKNVKIKGFLRDIKCYELKKEDTSKEDMFSLSGKGFQIDINKKKQVIFKNKSNYMNAGVYFFKHKILKKIKKIPFSLETNLLVNLINSKEFNGVKSSNFFIDIGTLSNLRKGEKILIIDDLIATGGTAEAAAKIIEISGGKVAGFIFVINLFDLPGNNMLKDKGYKTESLIEFPGH